MNKLFQAYNEILSNDKENNSVSLYIVDELINEIKSHIQYFIDKNDYQKYAKFVNFKFRCLDRECTFDDFKEQILLNYDIKCINEVLLKFKIVDLTLKKEFLFHLIPDTLINHIKDEPSLCFKGGTILNPTSSIYYAFKNNIHPDEDFKKLRKENIKIIQKIKMDSSIKTKKDESIQDILFQYMNYFRH